MENADQKAQHMGSAATSTTSLGHAKPAPTGHVSVVQQEERQALEELGKDHPQQKVGKQETGPSKALGLHTTVGELTGLMKGLGKPSIGKTFSFSAEMPDLKPHFGLKTATQSAFDTLKLSTKPFAREYETGLEIKRFQQGNMAQSQFKQKMLESCSEKTKWIHERFSIPERHRCLWGRKPFCQIFSRESHKSILSWPSKIDFYAMTI